MDPRFMMKMRDRDFVLYAGLLDAAHTRGLKSIETFLHQAPAADNGETAIVMCKATFKRDGEECIFSGIGDASPKNVAVAVKESLIRMAETRAKARALRDGVNIGITAFEEIDGSSARNSGASRAARATEPVMPMNNSGEQCPSCHCPDGYQHTSRCKAVEPVAQQATGETTASAEGASCSDGVQAKLRIEDTAKPASPAQLSTLRSMCGKLGWDPAEFVRDQCGVNIERLAFAQASELITELTNRKRSALASAR